MSTEPQDSDWRRIAAYLEGTLSAAERAAFDHWIDAAPGRADALRRMRAVWSAGHAPRSVGDEERAEQRARLMSTLSVSGRARVAGRTGAVASGWRRAVAAGRCVEPRR